MIVFFIFVTVNLTICSSYFMTEPLIILKSLELNHFAGLWVNKLPDEIVQQHMNICKFLTTSLIIMNSNISWSPDNIYYKFIENSPIFGLSEKRSDQPFMFQKSHSLHLLPCHLTKYTDTGESVSQTIYITKVLNFKSLIMIVNDYPFLSANYLLVLGFITDIADLQLLGYRKFTVLLNAFSHLIEQKPKKNYKTSSKYLYFRHHLTAEEQLQIFKLCASVHELLSEIRKQTQIKQEIVTLKADLWEKDFSSNGVVLRLKVMQCNFSEKFTCDLIYHAPNTLFIRYDDTNTKNELIALFGTENNDTILWLNSIFVHIDNFNKIPTEVD